MNLLLLKFIFQLVKFVNFNRVRMSQFRDEKKIIKGLFADSNIYGSYFIVPLFLPHDWNAFRYFFAQRTLAVIIHDVPKCNGKAIYFNCFRLTPTPELFTFGETNFSPQSFSHAHYQVSLHHYSVNVEIGRGDFSWMHSSKKGVVITHRILCESS